MGQSHGHSAAGGIMLMKNSNDTIGNWTRKLPACSAVPEPTAPPSIPRNEIGKVNTPLSWSRNSEYFMETIGSSPCFTTARHLPLSWARSIQLTLSHSIPSISMLIFFPPSTLRLSKLSLSSGLFTKTLHAPRFSPICATRSAHFFLDLRLE